MDQFLKKDDFKNKPEVKSEIVNEIQLYNNNSVETQIEAGRRYLVDNKFLNHVAACAEQLVYDYEDEVTDLTDRLGESKLVINEYERRHGKLDEEALKKLMELHASRKTLVASDQKRNKIWKKLMLIDKKIQASTK